MGRETDWPGFIRGPSGDVDPWRPSPLNIQPRALAQIKAKPGDRHETGGLEMWGGEEALLEE